MKNYLVIVAFVVFAVPASLVGQENTSQLFPATIHKVHDGDTVQVTIHFPWNISLGPEWVRSASFDAWEVTKTRRTVKITDEEIAKGKVAKTALEGLLKSGEVFVAPTSSKGSRDSYGRLLGNLFIKTKDGTIDVQQWMKERGHERN